MSNALSIEEFDNMFDLLWKNMLDHTNNFNFLTEKINYPVDIYETSTGINFEIAVVGIESKNIDIEVDNEILRIKYLPKKTEADTKKYLYKGIAKRAFDLSWKVSAKYDLTKLSADMDKGLLVISIPTKENKESKKLTFKPQTRTLPEVKA
jgi:HSP20 family molecular chaperone IbpA